MILQKSWTFLFFWILQCHCQVDFDQLPDHVFDNYASYGEGYEDYDQYEDEEIDHCNTDFYDLPLAQDCQNRDFPSKRLVKSI